MRIAYFDCFNGAGGDMLVGALLAAGASAERVQAGLAGLKIPELAVRIEAVRKQGFAATKFTVVGSDGDAAASTAGAPAGAALAHVHDHGDGTPHHHHGGHAPHRHLKHIRKILEAADLPGRVRQLSLAVFERLADAEAAAHGIDREAVHFHEVGAVDAIADVVGAMLALEDLRVERCVCSPLPVGSGTVRCDHGIMPVPAPATALLLEGVPIAPTAETGELLTPTAAAVLTTICQDFGPLPAMTVESVGFGAGTREGQTLPNLARVWIGEAGPSEPAETVVVLEANLDDAPGEWLGYAVSRLLEEGALDAYCVPIYMKKNRPGVILTVLCAPDRAAALEAVLFAETPTFGVRRHTTLRTKLDRAHETVVTAFGPIRVKVGRRGEAVLSAAPEFDDCAAAARQHCVALRVVMDAAMQAWRSKPAES
jgi:uncharacterized protein (TIGR00299 family) protein